MTDDLDALLDRAVAKAVAEGKIKQARKRLIEDKLSSGERAALHALVNHYDEARLWDIKGYVALVQSTSCLSCSSVHTTFIGWMQEQRHRSQAATRRLVAVAQPLSSTMRVEVHHSKPSTHCPSCIEGFIEEKRKEYEDGTGPLIHAREPSLDDPTDDLFPTREEIGPSAGEEDYLLNLPLHAEHRDGLEEDH